MNKTEAIAIFIREAICFGETDSIPVKKAISILGFKAVEYISKSTSSQMFKPYYNMYSIPNVGNFTYITLEGFLAGVTYNNCLQLQVEKDTKAGEGKIINFLDRKEKLA